MIPVKISFNSPELLRRLQPDRPTKDLSFRVFYVAQEQKVYHWADYYDTPVGLNRAYDNNLRQPYRFVEEGLDLFGHFLLGK